MLRLITWNVRVGGFRKKIKHISILRPDVLVAQEVENLDSVLVFPGDCQPTCRHRLHDPAYPRRAIGVFSFTETTITAIDTTDVISGFLRYEARRGDLSFNVVGVWTSATNSRQTTYKQAHDGLRRYGDWIRRQSTVVLGDFNNNASWTTGDWPGLIELVNNLALVSAYHVFFGEELGKESRPTYFHRGKEASPAHLDYCFIPREWATHLTNVTVGVYSEWRHVSDHAPLIVDLDF